MNAQAPDQPAVEDWFPAALRSHLDRCPSASWTEIPPGHYRWLMEQLVNQRVSAEEFEQASDSVAQVNPHPSQHASALLSRIRAARAEAALQSREQAFALSKDCPVCGGSGFALVSERPRRAGWCSAGCAISLWMRERADPEFNRSLSSPTGGVISNG